jgi:hypothetical protein
VPGRPQEEALWLAVDLAWLAVWVVAAAWVAALAAAVPQAVVAVVVVECRVAVAESAVADRAARLGAGAGCLVARVRPAAECRRVAAGSVAVVPAAALLAAVAG